ncbi:hypothetical protein, partial [Nocardiopsis halotolerans]|uniref:hypothetical protein n=1 Tax=Nocardiopsis halotolerans TaxID=124252 RepID=UPI0005933105
MPNFQDEASSHRWSARIIAASPARPGATTTGVGDHPRRRRGRRHRTEGGPSVNTAIEVTDATVRYGDVLALDG